MFEFKEDGRGYRAPLYVGKDCKISMLLDTGAEFTVLSFDDARNALNCTRDTLLRFVDSNKGITAHGIAGEDFDVIPCYLRNVRLGTETIPVFYFGLSKSVSRSLIGCDFISSTNAIKYNSTSFVITDLDNAKYLALFKETFHNETPSELLVMSAENDPVVWYKQLPAEYKDKLHQYSVPLYTVLNVGQYLDEFDGILAGFRAQYNV